MAFWRKNLAFSELAIVTNLEYRFNFIIDAFVQPAITVMIELLLWLAVFKSTQALEIGGFSKEHYMAYAIWAPFVGRITISWMYESMMIEEVASGSINVILTRPISFYEYYLSQLMGYKIVTTVLSLMMPLAASLYFDLPVDYSKLPIALALVVYYLFLVHTLSFIISTFAFFLTRVRSLTLVKNLSLFLLAGELVPLDLMPPLLAKVLLILPFSSGVYVPVAYITGRIGIETVANSFLSISFCILIFCSIGQFLWNRGLRIYTGTGA